MPKDSVRINSVMWFTFCTGTEQSVYLTIYTILMPLPEDWIPDMEHFLSKSKYEILSKCNILGLLM